MSIVSLICRLTNLLEKLRDKRRKNGGASQSRDKNIAGLENEAARSGRRFLEALRALAAVIHDKDPYTRGHSERVTRFSVEIASIMGLPEQEIEQIRMAALIHDIGKIDIDDRILKKPETLTEAEYEEMKTHTTRGYEMLKHIPQLEIIAAGMEAHHERLDGSGYPRGLRGSEIPLLARIITVADCFDAMTTTRPYQDPAPVEKALSIIRSEAGMKYDKKVVRALIEGVRAGRIMTRLEDRTLTRS